MANDFTTIDTVLFSRNRTLLCALTQQLRGCNVELHYKPFYKITRQDLILVVRGMSAAEELNKVLEEKYRNRAIVLIKPAEYWDIFKHPSHLVKLQREIEELGYPFVLVNQSNEQIASYACKVIRKYFI